MKTDDELLEALELAMDRSEKQDEIIHDMSQIILRQATKLAEIRNIERVEQKEDPKSS